MSEEKWRKKRHQAFVGDSQKVGSSEKVPFLPEIRWSMVACYALLWLTKRQKEEDSHFWPVSDFGFRLHHTDHRLELSPFHCPEAALRGCRDRMTLACMAVEVCRKGNLNACAETVVFLVPRRPNVKVNQTEGLTFSP